MRFQIKTRSLKVNIIPNLSFFYQIPKYPVSKSYLSFCLKTIRGSATSKIASTVPKLHLEVVDTNHGKQMLIYTQLWSNITHFYTFFQPLNPIFNLLLALFVVLLNHVCCFVLSRCKKRFSILFFL